MTADATPRTQRLSFSQLRPKLMRVAYRMLGSVADAEDIMQEAFIRWMKADRSEVREPEAFLRRIVMRLCLDQLKSARRTAGDLYRPLASRSHRGRGRDRETSPCRLCWFWSAFLLSSGRPFCCTTCSDWNSRRSRPRSSATLRLAGSLPIAPAIMSVEARPRFKVERQHGLAIAEAFFTASRNGDMKALGAMLAADVSLHADGGGKRPAATRAGFRFRCGHARRMNR